MQKLILGTAAFGSSYGIKNDGIPNEKELEKIACAAWNGGIRVIHTSWQYNLPKICDAIFSEFEKIEKYSDNPDYFSWSDGAAIGKVIYKPVDLQDIQDRCEILQVPVNILDSRFIKPAKKAVSDYMEHFEIHARSVFLQGLLLMDELPGWLPEPTRCLIYCFHVVARANRLEPYEAALGYVLGLDEIDRVIVGVNSAKQLAELLTVKSIKWDYDFSITDENVLDPRRWPKG